MARLLWANILPLGEGGSVVEVMDWWNIIEESDQWQRGIYFALCAAYSLPPLLLCQIDVNFRMNFMLANCVLLVVWVTRCLYLLQVQLGRIQLRVPEYGWTTQKVFHLMNFVVNGLRALLLGLYQSVFFIRPKALEQVLRDLPGLLFFSTYALLVLFWAEIYHQARRTPAHRLRPAYFIINGIIYFTQVCIWISITINRASATLEAAKLFLSVISSCAAFGFLLYGGRLFFLLRRFPIESRGRQKKLYEVGSVTSICCACFMIRCVLVLAVSAFDKKADLDVLDHHILDLLYYLTVEIIPSGLVPFILRKLPPKRIYDQYQPIR